MDRPVGIAVPDVGGARAARCWSREISSNSPAICPPRARRWRSARPASAGSPERWLNAGCLKTKSLPAGRHHADRRRCPARTEAAAVPLTAHEACAAPAVVDVAVIVPVAPLALAAGVRANDGLAVDLRELRPVARKIAVAVPEALGMNLDLDGQPAGRGRGERGCRQQPQCCGRSANQTLGE